MWVLYTPVKHVPLDSGRLFIYKTGQNRVLPAGSESTKISTTRFWYFLVPKSKPVRRRMCQYNLFVITPTQTGVIGKIPKNFQKKLKNRI